MAHERGLHLERRYVLPATFSMSSLRPRIAAVGRAHVLVAGASIRPGTCAVDCSRPFQHERRAGTAGCRGRRSAVGDHATVPRRAARCRNRDGFAGELLTLRPACWTGRCAASGRADAGSSASSRSAPRALVLWAAARPRTRSAAWTIATAAAAPAPRASRRRAWHAVEDRRPAPDQQLNTTGGVGRSTMRIAGARGQRERVSALPEAITRRRASPPRTRRRPQAERGTAVGSAVSRDWRACARCLKSVDPDE